MVDQRSEALEWDAVIEVPEEFERVEPGVYVVEVEDITRGNFAGSAKMDACPVAKVQARIVSGKNEGRKVFDQLKLSTRVLFLVTAFFKSIGMLDADAKDERFKMDWTGAIGRRGLVELTERTYNDKIYTDIKWLKPGEKEPTEPAVQQPQAAQPQAPQAAIPAPPAVQSMINQAFTQQQAPQQQMPQYQPQAPQAQAQQPQFTPANMPQGGF